MHKTSSLHGDNAANWRGLGWNPMKILQSGVQKRQTTMAKSAKSDNDSKIFQITMVCETDRIHGADTPMNLTKGGIKVRHNVRQLPYSY